ncbi:UNVERIFIED_CONTAM: DNA (cytosine-5)-methyltransferase 1B [Sesamum radiatum]|uniref:DNA (Cytosine-5)-methyltransferase 1B n=1 Tax=Sesamum radiatum TaxID=300843 RepID=A0AAW2S418_SESRA
MVAAADVESVGSGAVRFVHVPSCFVLVILWKQIHTVVVCYPESSYSLFNNETGIKKSKSKLVSASKKKMAADQKQRKRLASETSEDPIVSRKMPKRAAACSDFREKSLRISKKDSVLETKKDGAIEEEAVAVRLTAGQEDGRHVDGSQISPFIIQMESHSLLKCWKLMISLSLVLFYRLREVLKRQRKGYQMRSACIEVYKILTKASGSNLTLDELLAGVVRAMSGMKCFSGGLSIRDFVVSQGDFIYNQLIGLDETSKKTDQLFVEIPVLIALRDESSKLVDLAQAQPGSLPGNLRIGPKCGDENKKNLAATSGPTEEDEDLKMARVLQEEERWRSMKQKKSRGSTSSTSKYYIKINEDEIANDYPLPAYYKTSNEETMNARLVPLELLPLKPCAEIDVTIFGSGIMTADDGSGYICDGDSTHSSSGSGASAIEGIPVFLSAIKEWVIEFGSSMISISIRTDMAWYRLGKPSKQYAPWYEQVLKTARLAISIITLLKDQIRVARLSFADVIKRISDFTKDHPAFISSNAEVVERYVVVHGQIILQQFSEYPDDTIKKCALWLGSPRKWKKSTILNGLSRKRSFCTGMNQT